MSTTRLNPEYQQKGSYLEYKGIASSVSKNFNDITSPGVYYLNGTAMSNGPSNYTWCYLVVLGFITDFPAITQIVVKPVAGVLSMREYSGSPAAWRAWVNK